jgi:GTP diphosphokinase / guanosine-3',5'-bis(diphosphate) 3'-diphosphatase
MEPLTYQPTFQDLRVLIEPKLNEQELLVVTRAFEVAKTAHSGQMRDEGTPYILHPLRVAILLARELQLYSVDLLCGALLHDVIEDTDLTREELTEMFGPKVSRIVWLLTKFDDTSLPAYLAEIEAAADTGAPIVKLCDRLDNLRFLVRSPKAEKKRRYIRTTEQHYLPMASRHSAYLFEQLSNSLQEARGNLSTVGD